ncbi:MAG: glycosyltransferase [Chloroflexi bacterium]|nr:glycosyltransferase [Chloroflexota bacterium]
MKVSVIVPAFNEERYLPSCLRSLRAQDYKGEWETIVVDNASTDATAQVARDFGVRVISCPRKGVVFARQAGVEAAGGDIIIQTDADAVLPRDWLARIVRRLMERPDAVAVSGDVRYLSPPLWVHVVSFLWRLTKKVGYWLTGQPPTILASNLSYRREAFVRAGGYNTDLPGIGDEYDFLGRLKKIGKVVYDGGITISVSSRRLHGRFLQYVFVDVLYYSLVANLFYGLSGRTVAGERLDIRIEDTFRLQPRWLYAAVLPVVIAAIAVSVYAYFSPGSQVFGRVYSREPAPTKGVPAPEAPAKIIALTFDDGPNEPYTSQVLDILKRYDVKATFFVLGKNVEYYPEVTGRIIAEGHALGNHTYDHKKATALVEWDRQIDRAQDVIARTVGVKPRLFRPPFGQKTPWELDSMRKRGYVTIAWSISANDPNVRSSDVIARRVIRKAQPGGIILLHDGFETRHGWDRSPTVQALPAIVESLKAQGYTFVTIPELLDIPAYFE